MNHIHIANADLIYQGGGITPSLPALSCEISEIVRFLLGRGGFSSKWRGWKNFQAVFLKKDPQMLRAMGAELGRILEECANKLPSPSKPGPEVLFESFVGNLLALIPFSYPQKGAAWTIPLKVDGVWQKFQYTTDQRIDLLPFGPTRSIPAFGFTSSNGGPPLLSFLGTTFPAADGFAATVLSDMTPGMSVGHAPYLIGKKKIEKWLNDKQGVRLFGMSLGGALAFHALRHHRDKIAQIDAYNPPGLYPWDWKETYEDGPKINIYYQYNDLVASMGTFPTGKNVSVYRIASGKGENTLKAHARVYTGGEQVTILKSSPEYENRRFCRTILTILHIISAPFSFIIYSIFYLLCLPFVLLIRKLSPVSEPTPEQPERIEVVVAPHARVN